MTLLTIQLLSILKPKMNSIPEIIEELRVAQLLENATEIIERHETDPANQIHISAYHMAREMNLYFRQTYAQLATTKSEHGNHGQNLLTLIDQSDQLAAHHLDMLDRLTNA